MTKMATTDRRVSTTAAQVGRHPRQWFMAATLVGGLIRLAWASVATSPSQQWYAEWNLRLAEQLADGSTPTFGGVPTAYWPPGFGIVLAPVAWISEHTGLISLTYGASLVNVAFGTATIVLVGLLAARWVSPGARTPAAWIMALAPGHVAATSVAVSEPAATTLWVAILLGATVLLKDRAEAPQGRQLVALGVLLGLAVLMKDISITLLAVPALTVRSSRGNWRGALRPTLLVATGAALLLVPWAIRNAVQVGWPSPFATISSEGLCATKYDQDIREYFEQGGGPAALDPELLADCYPNSIFDNQAAEIPEEISMPEGWDYQGPDEGAWARRNNAGYWSWAVRNPVHFLRVTPLRLHGIAANDSHGGVELATQFGQVPVLGGRGAEVIQWLSTAWYHIVLALALIGLARLAPLRRAIPIWYPLVIFATYTILGPWSQSRHAFTAYPFLVVLASGTVMALRAADGSRGDPAVSGREEPADHGPDGDSERNSSLDECETALPRSVLNRQ